MAVKGGPEIVAALNEVLAAELAAVNQYFLHARMYGNWGYHRLYEKVRSESIDEMKHADQLIARVLYLDGLPNVQKLGRIRIGEKPREMLQADLALEQEAIPRLNAAVALCREHGDNGTRLLVEEILHSEEEHLDWLEAQLHLMGELGDAAYLAEQIKD
jgi:bacterioferritin